MRGQRLTIYQRIVVVSAVAILLTLSAMLLVIFRGPPPIARPVSAYDLAMAAGGDELGGWTVKRSTRAVIGTTFNGRPRAEMAAEIARLSHFPVEAVRLYETGPTLPFARFPRPPRHGWPFFWFGRPPGPPGPPFPHDPLMRMRMRMSDFPTLHAPFLLALRHRDRWAILAAEPRPQTARWYAITLGLMAGVFVLLMIPLRRVARAIGGPISRLAAAADQGDDLPVDAGDGAPPEVRELVAAIQRMQTRIRDQERDRAAMLGAIAHDLRTPMTRLSFRVDKLPEAERDRAQSDIAEMQTMIASILAFMDGRRQPPSLAQVDAASLIETLVQGYIEQGAAIRLYGDGRLVVRADPMLLRRCAQNVIDNALRYAGNARVTLRTGYGLALLIVEDDGPGIAESHIARATEPFWRGEASRARDTGGAGLGLAIVAEGMAAMGGTLQVANRAEGGLRVTLGIPLTG